MFEKIASDERFKIAETLVFHEKVAEFIKETPVEKLAELLERISNDYRQEFKKQALADGFSKEYVQGVFDTSEKLCKKAIRLPIRGGNMLRSISREFEEEAPAAVSSKPFNLTNMLFGDPETNKATFMQPNRDIAMSGVHGLGAAGLTSMIPGVGPIAAPFVGAHAFAKHRWGPRSALGMSAAGGLGLAGLGGLGYEKYIAPQPGEDDQNAWVGQKGLGTIGGLALGGIAANQMGLKGWQGIPLALLGAYGGSYLPQIMNSVKNMGSSGIGSYGSTDYSKYLNPAIGYSSGETNPSAAIAAAQQQQ